VCGCVGAAVTGGKGFFGFWEGAAGEEGGPEGAVFGKGRRRRREMGKDGSSLEAIFASLINSLYI